MARTIPGVTLESREVPRPKLVEQYSGSVGYANRVTTFGALGGLDFLQMRLMRSYAFVSLVTSPRSGMMPIVVFAVFSSVLCLMGAEQLAKHPAGAGLLFLLVVPCLG